ncbi:N-acetyl-gamma-glutamyl-phosphate reductase [Chryseotalea sanaruensis]|uniref:N-acetyl-gamma-glutamyl-phosphate reductase n=1 Tax=Chryseotalea sanaruensis TaxID=2482724 RepID=A0A401UAA2_9BACT|nr:N-acetyl-gamma-glutamyl-phosphate reductase [Chryseotalea sanaruensis]GCC51848.1 N-acetyl-gamma-glutamyl-phosphate reductase [Chryseotalea sanaruensis]
MGEVKIKAGIIGGAGYTGGETIRLLLNHPLVEISFIHSRSNAGKKIHAIHRDLLGESELTFTDKLEQADVLFLCLGHGESKKFLEENPISAITNIIDLSQDFRLDGNFSDRSFVYGLPELNKQNITQAKSIANPGCFATAIQLGLLPLANAGLLSEVYTTGITGSTGAGQKLQDTTHFTWRANNISAYKTLVHQHLGEIKKSLTQLQQHFSAPINFIPWRGDFPRGIFVSSVISTDLTLKQIQNLFADYYAQHPFTVVSDDTIDLKQVVNTNKCIIGIEKDGNKVVIHTAIDNLLKGASGQAVQNMNLMFGFNETTGLKLKSIVF